VTLGNTGHQLEVTAEQESVIEEALTRLNQLAAQINADDLVNHLLRQIGINGALSIEWVSKSDLSGIEKAILVPVTSIRFKYDKQRDLHVPHQLVSRTNRYIELSEATYSYIPLETAEGSPYAIPPFLAALGNAVIQLFMMDNIKFIIKKLGLLGFISMVMEMPPAKHGEEDEHYRARLQSMQQDFATNFAENYREGVAVHFDNVKLEHRPVAADARGATDIIKVNEEQIASGLKTDPAMLGRSYSTTETYAGVVYGKMVERLDAFRRMVKRAIEKGYKLDLWLGGIPVRDVSLAFNANKAMDPRAEAETERILTETAILKMEAGLISPDEAARELGYEEAYFSLSADREPVRLTLALKNGSYVPVRSNIEVSLRTVEDATEREVRIEARRLRWVNSYFRDIAGIDDGARMEVIRETRRLLESGQIMMLTPELFAQELYMRITRMYPEALFEAGLRTAVQKSVEATYEYYRIKDRLLAKGRLPVRFTDPDYRGMRFLRDLDDFHFSKFLEKDAPKKQMMKFLEKEYLEKGHEDLDGFTRRFGQHFRNVSRTSTKRVVDTSVSRIRNHGHIRQLAQQRIGTAEVSEVMDRITCDTCRALDGKTFPVRMASEKINELSELSAEKYAKRVFDLAPEGWKQDPAGYASENSLETFILNDMVGPPWHSNCRGRLVVKS